MPKKAVIFKPGNKHRAKLIMNTIQWVLRVFQFLHYLLKVVVYGFYPKTRLSDEEHRLQYPFSKIVHVVALICYIQNRFFCNLPNTCWENGNIALASVPKDILWTSFAASNDSLLSALDLSSLQLLSIFSLPWSILWMFLRDGRMLPLMVSFLYFSKD